MPYDRVYSLDEVHRILYESELRPRPTSLGRGHALGQHGDMREDITDWRFKPVILLAETLEQTRAMRPEDGVGTPIPPYKFEPSDGKFLSRKDILKAVHEALNSPGGQAELRKLNGPKKSVKIEEEIVLNRGKIQGAVCQHPTINPGPNPVFVRPPVTEGTVKRIVVIVDKLPSPERPFDIHVHTAYPKQVV